MRDGLKLWCVSLNEQSVGCCVDVLVKCVQCIQWTSVSHRATAAEMTHVGHTDFMSLHQIEAQRDVQVSADPNLETCKGTSQKTSSISHRDIGTLSVSGGNSNIFITSVYESKTKRTSLKDVSLNVFCEQ